MNIVRSLSDAKTAVLSAKRTKHIWFDDLCMSVIYKCKSTGPNTEPYRTPNVMFDIEELEFLTDILFPITQIRLNQLCMRAQMSLCNCLLINMSGLTVSNSFEKSRYVAMVLCLLSIMMTKHNLEILWNPNGIFSMNFLWNSN